MAIPFEGSLELGTDLAREHLQLILLNLCNAVLFCAIKFGPCIHVAEDHLGVPFFLGGLPVFCRLS